MASPEFAFDNIDLSMASRDLLLNVGRQDVRVFRNRQFLSVVH